MTKLIKHYYAQDKATQKAINKQYHAWVSYLPCCVTGSVMVSRPHHLRYVRYCGMGYRSPAIFEIPITYKIHTLIHTKGVKYVEKKFKVDFIDILTELHKEFVGMYLKGEL